MEVKTLQGQMFNPISDESVYLLEMFFCFDIWGTTLGFQVHSLLRRLIPVPCLCAKYEAGARRGLTGDWNQGEGGYQP